MICGGEGMFREDFYRMLRDDFELWEFSVGEGKERLPLLVGFMEKEKEENIRILVRENRLKIAGAKEANELAPYLKTGFLELLDFMEEQQMRIGKCGEKEELLRFMGIRGDISFKDLKKAIGQRRRRVETYFEEERTKEELELQKENLDRAGRIVAGLWDETIKDDPYIALRTVYLDYQLQERTGEELLEKARSIYQRKYIIDEEKVRKLLTAERDADSLEELEAAVEQLRVAILKAEAKAFLYDAGFPMQNRDKRGKKKEDSRKKKKVKRKRRIEENYCLDGDFYEEAGDVCVEEDEPPEKLTGAEKEKSMSRRQDRTMNLIGYCMDQGIPFDELNAGKAAGASTDLDSAEFQEGAEQLFYSLRRNKRKRAFVPLYIDGKTGAGIYIMGRELIPQEAYDNWKQDYRERYEKGKLKFSKEELEKRIKTITKDRCCHYCYVNWGELSEVYWDQDLQGYYVDGKEQGREDWYRGLIMRIWLCTSIRGAVVCCKKGQDPENLEMDSYNAYRELNESLIEGVEKKYWNYFESADWEMDEDAEEAGNEEEIRKQVELERKASEMPSGKPGVSPKGKAFPGYSGKGSGREMRMPDRGHPREGGKKY